MLFRSYVTEDVPTACTNGRDEKYGRAFIKNLREQELNFLVAHEAGHKLYRHLTTWRKLYDENHKLANQACDYVINLMLKDSDPNERTIAMPRFKEDHPEVGKRKGDLMGLIDERFRGMNAKQVFDILKQEQKDKGRGQGDGDGEGLDDHEWEGAENMTEEEKRQLERDIDQAIRQGVMAQQKIAGKGAGGIEIGRAHV